jgi:hypothetical protein
MCLQNLEICDKLVPSVNDLWFESIHGFKLVDWKFLNTYKGNKDGKKKRANKALMKRDKIGKVFLFIHFHGLTNLSRPLHDESDFQVIKALVSSQECVDIVMLGKKLDCSLNVRKPNLT